MSTILVNNIKDTGNNTLLTSDGSGNISSGGAITNTPAFQVSLSADQTFNDLSTTKINFDFVHKDTNSGYDTTNKRFVVPSGGNGTYFLSARCKFIEQDNRLEQVVIYIYKNGLAYLNNSWRDANNTHKILTLMLSGMVCDCVQGDYFEVFAYVNAWADSNATLLQDELENCSFEGHKLIGA